MRDLNTTKEATTGSGTAVSSKKSGGSRDAFAHINTWIFDLDDTLYPRSVDLHGQLRARVVTFIADHMKIDRTAAEAVHLDYYERFGSTLQGLVQLHGVVPHAFLEFVHDIDLSALERNESLIGAIRALPGRRVVFTNASHNHAKAALEAMGMADLFNAVASIEDYNFVGKPHLTAFSGFFDHHSVDPTSAAMFDDRPGNLLVPHQSGMKTVLVVDPLIDDTSTIGQPSHVDAVATNLAAFLRELIEKRAA